MKPIKLTITAFGPYKHSETIDFRELNEQRLFVISGNTGAGKTSIFDAICFALYGDASGEDREDAKMLRSQFATDEESTSVDFEFELRSRTYRVFRQMAHVKGTNKTATGDKYEIYETTGGSEVLLVDRLTVGNVNQKIQDIIGLTKDQFKQIVMLPQGEFRKLLTSDTENKEEILRKIFKTGLYQSMTERLNEKRITSQKQYEAKKQERDLYIQNVEKSLPKREDSLLTQVFEQENYNTHQVLEALTAEMTHYKEKATKQKSLHDEHKKKLQEQTNHYHQAKTVNERFDALSIMQQQKEDMEQQLPLVQAKEKKLQQAVKASQIDIHEDHYLAVKSELDELKQTLEAQALELEHADKELTLAEVAYKEEEQKETERERATLSVSKLHEYIPDVTGLDKKKQELAKLEKQVEQLKEKANQLNTELQENKNEKSNLSHKIKELEASVKSLPEKTEQLLEVREQVKALQECIDLTTKQTERSIVAFKTEAILGNVNEEYKELETKWIEGQASILAEHLHDGAACPVCGSHEHPNKAELAEEIPTKEMLENKRSEKDEVERAFFSLQAELGTITSQVETKEQELRKLGIEPSVMKATLENVLNHEQDLQTEITRQKADQQTLDQCKDKLAQVEETIEQLEGNKNLNEQQWNETLSTYKTEQALYDQRLKTIPEELQSLEALQEEIKQAEQAKQTLEQKWKTVQEQLNFAKERMLTVKTKVESFTNQQKITSEKLEKALTTFKEALLEADFQTEDEYTSSKMTKTEREALTNEIDSFKTDFTSIKKQITELETELQDKERFNLVTLEEQLRMLEEEIEKKRSELTQVEHHLTTAEDANKNILAASEQVKEAEENFYLHKDLYDVVRGDNNKRMSFERYLQIEFLDQIVQAANQRLHRLSNGQFYLIRSDRLEKRGKQSGLSLDVYDNYTGHNRDVKTLSGGEKFNASLSLALGMADVIQSHQGGISIETMFIDEGFGSLDEESLNKAIDTLVDLQQSGRLIGVISHVQELKQAIPAVLEVKKTKEGYSKTEFVIK